MKLTHTRTISQAFFLGLFFFLTLSMDSSRMGGYPVILFLELDPLLALTSALASWTLYGGMILCLFVLLPTTFIGRFFCGWVCPMGTLNHAFSRLLGPRDLRGRIERNRYRRAFAIKYYVLVAVLVLALFGVNPAGVLDPIGLLTRSVATSLAPAGAVVSGGHWLPMRMFRAGWLLGGILLALLLLNAIVPRFFCRVLCPLGALLGTVARMSLFHVRRSEARCIHCDRCVADCQGACDPQGRLRKAECFVCMQCRQDCPTQAITFSTMPPERETLPGPDVSRRRLLETGVLAIAAFPLLRASTRPDRLPPPGLIRPPGSEPEDGFLGKCVRCGACMKVCPTNVIQPALLEATPEGIWTPVMINRIGYCEYNCNLCGQVCPTGAIRRFSLAEKHGLPPHERPIKLGTAFVDKSRCLPWAMNIPCIVCEEMCPVSPKAIYLERAEAINSGGRRVALLRPVVDPARCIGCGVCENRCPVHDMRAIRVSSVGESRSRTNLLLLKESGPSDDKI